MIETQQNIHKALVKKRQWGITLVVAVVGVILIVIYLAVGQRQTTGALAQYLNPCTPTS
jgi:hypothetical protein